MNGKKLIAREKQPYGFDLQPDGFRLSVEPLEEPKGQPLAADITTEA